jgi:hypothetical protein
MEGSLNTVVFLLPDMPEEKESKTIRIKIKKRGEKEKTHLIKVRWGDSP